MFTVNSISGNIFEDSKFESIKTKDSEFLKISRMDLQKSRLRRKTDKGTDIGLDLDTRNPLRHGDVIEYNEKVIFIEQIPEKVISIKLKNKYVSSAEVLVMIGHIVGNRHRPISINNEIISFPIQADSELEVFQKLFNTLSDYIEMKIEEIIFIPQTGANIHEH